MNLSVGSDVQSGQEIQDMEEDVTITVFAALVVIGVSAFIGAVIEGVMFYLGV